MIICYALSLKKSFTGERSHHAIIFSPNHWFLEPLIVFVSSEAFEFCAIVFFFSFGVVVDTLNPRVFFLSFG